MVRDVGSVALGVGILVLTVTLAGQTGVLEGHDFAGTALLGLLGAMFCAGVLARRPRAAGTQAAAGLLLCLMPVGLLCYYLATTDG